MARKPKEGEQGKLALKERGWGGARKGAGRKPKGPRPMGDRPATPHLARPAIERRHPVHLTLRLMPEVWNLRSKRAYRVLAAALLGVREMGLRLTHYSAQGNHLHMIAEVETRSALSRAMRSLSIRAAKGLNKLMGRKGRVFADRYHLVVLKTPRQVANAIRYVLSNTRKHMLERGEKPAAVTFDAYAAGPAEHVPRTMRLLPSALVLEPRTWLLGVGWRRAVPT
ncbi:hypothetical protein [Vulgatibacter sp.]|uniref:hypothetical protein n=1 Tax=Vulgatibacter sp. TaxID=1971226 RepID=UPI00356222B0